MCASILYLGKKSNLFISLAILQIVTLVFTQLFTNRDIVVYRNCITEALLKRQCSKHYKWNKNLYNWKYWSLACMNR